MAATSKPVAAAPAVKPVSVGDEGVGRMRQPRINWPRRRRLEGSAAAALTYGGGGGGSSGGGGGSKRLQWQAAAAVGKSGGMAGGGSGPAHMGVDTVVHCTTGRGYRGQRRHCRWQRSALATDTQPKLGAPRSMAAADSGV